MARNLAALFSIATLAAACTIPGSQVDVGDGLAGTYVVNGVDPLGIEYSGTVVIGETQAPDEFVLSWIVTGSIQSGTGRKTGDTLDVEWEATEGPRAGSTGTATYTINDNGWLIGERFIDGTDGAGTEEIIPTG
ncbi:MAG: hypothetical protein OEQ47_04250 [Acidimicrobiia bacterium]|nr:hypothetical protein [Acidimicrobiia bacterium]